jgi:hypothetical protein
MRELSIEEIAHVNGGVRMTEAAMGMAAFGAALALGPFVVAAGVAFAGAALLEGMDIAGW